MATSTNYGWAEPDNSSLVKNGASDMRTLGNAIDASVWNIGFGQAGKNKIINGNFGIWQRGTSFTTSGTTQQYNADRWLAIGDVANSTITQQTFTPGTAPVAGYEGQYYLRYVKGGTTANQMFLIQRAEDVRTFANQTITLSYWMKASTTITNEPLVQQNFGSGGSGEVYTTFSTHSVSTSWTRYSVTMTVPSISGKTIGSGSYLGFWPIRYVGTTNVTVEIWGVQAEIGSVATAFQTATGTIAGELQACQRYFYSGALSNAVLGVANSTTSVYWTISTPVSMRVAPTATYPSTLTGIVNDLVNAQNRTPTAIATYVNQVDKVSFYATGMPAVFAIGYPALIQTTITWSAEL